MFHDYQRVENLNTTLLELRYHCCRCYDYSSDAAELLRIYPL